MNARLMTLATLAFAGTAALAQAPAKQPPACASTVPFTAVERFAERIPFEFRHNKIWLEVVIGGKPRRLVFDTGSPTRRIRSPPPSRKAPVQARIARDERRCPALNLFRVAPVRAGASSLVAGKGRTGHSRRRAFLMGRRSPDRPREAVSPRGSSVSRSGHRGRSRPEPARRRCARCPSQCADA